MGDVLPMEIIQGVHNLSRKSLCLYFWQAAPTMRERQEIAVRNELHQNINVSVHLEAVFVLYDVRLRKVSFRSISYEDQSSLRGSKPS